MRFRRDKVQRVDLEAPIIEVGVVDDCIGLRQESTGPDGTPFKSELLVGNLSCLSLYPGEVTPSGKR